MATGAFGETRVGGPGHALSVLLRVVAGVIALWFLATVLILLTNFLMQFFGANMATGFGTWIVAHSKTVMSPFNGMFPTYHLFGSSVLDASMLAAIIIYALIGSAVTSLFGWFASLMRS
jgi:uncharacterized protein YggT (Ycf19 family)